MKMSYIWQFAMRVFVVSMTVLFNTAFAESRLYAPAELTAFIKNSLNQQPLLLSAQADIMAARANLTASQQAIYNPELELEYENTDANTKTIGISQTIDWGNQRGSRTAVASAELHVMSASYESTGHDYISRVLKGLADYQTAQQLQQLSDETLLIMQRFKSISEQHYQAGDLSQINLNLARLAYKQVVMDRARIVSAKVKARETLRAIVGTLPTTLPLLPENVPEPLLEKDLDSLLLQLPAIRSTMASLEVFKQQVTLRKSERAWKPTIGVRAGTEGKDNLIGLNLNIPLNVRNNFSAEVDVAYQNMIAFEQQARQIHRTIQANIIATTARYQNLLRAWDDWRETSQESVTQQLDLINQVWQAGDINTTDYILQIKQALEVKAAGLKLRNELWQAAFDWMNLTASTDKWLKISLLQEITK